MAMSNHYRVLVPVTVWVESYIWAGDEDDALDKVDDIDFDVVVDGRTGKIQAIEDGCAVVAGIEDNPDFNRMKFEITETRFLGGAFYDI